MSMVALRWVRKLRAPPTMKLILWAMADMANDHGECWPSMAALAEATGLTARPIQKALPVMVSAGLLEVEQSRGGRTNTYRLTMADRCVKAAARKARNPVPETPLEPTPTPSPGHPNPVPGTPPTPSLGRETPSPGHPEAKEPPLEAKENPKPRARRDAVEWVAPVVEIPPWLPADAWTEWCDHRVRKAKKAWTQRAAELSLRTLADARSRGDDPREVIERSIASGWTGLFPSRGANGARASASAQTSLLDATIRAQMARRHQPPPEEDFDAPIP